MKQKSQEEILQDIQVGNGNSALAYLYEHTLPKVRSYVLKNSGTRDEAKDIFQDAVIVFFHQVRENRYDRHYDIQAFLYTVARNLWIDRARREKRMVKYDHPGALEGKTDYKDHLGVMIEAEKTKAMREVFLKLDEKCQKILHYHLFEKKSMQDISVLMGYSSADVAKTNHYRCKQYLAKLVKSDENLVSLLKQ